MTSPMDDLNITLNDTALTHLGAWSADTLSWRTPRGSWDLEFSLDKPIGWRHPDIVRGARVIAWIGPTPIWRGQLTEPDFDTQSFVAIGASRESEDALCLGFGGALTTTPATAVSWAILRGALPSWNAANTLPSTPFAATEETVTYNHISDLLDAWATSASVNWWVDPYGYASYAAAPTEPALFITPGAGVLGVADDDYVTDLYGRYQSSSGVVSSVDRHAPTQGAGRIERGVDLTARGTMTAAAAEAVLDGILAQGSARTGWTNGLQLGYGQIATDGGTLITLSEVARLCGAGQMARLLGLFDERGASAQTDIVVGEAIWKPADQSITLNPVGLAARDLSSIVESMGGVLL